MQNSSSVVYTDWPRAPAASAWGDSQPSIITSVVVIRLTAMLASTIGPLSASVAPISRASQRRGAVVG